MERLANKTEVRKEIPSRDKYVGRYELSPSEKRIDKEKEGRTSFIVVRGEKDNSTVRPRFRAGPTRNKLQGTSKGKKREF